MPVDPVFISYMGTDDRGCIPVRKILAAVSVGTKACKRIKIYIDGTARIILIITFTT